MVTGGREESKEEKPTLIQQPPVPIAAFHLPTEWPPDVSSTLEMHNQGICDEHTTANLGLWSFLLPLQLLLSLSSTTLLPFDMAIFICLFES